MLSMLARVASAEPTAPQSIFALPDRIVRHLSGRQMDEIAIELFSPKKDSRDMLIVKVNEPNHNVAETMVGTGVLRVVHCSGNKKVPIVELAWAPFRNQLSKPYIFSSLG